MQVCRVNSRGARQPSDLNIVLKWFKENQMMAIPANFQFMMLRYDSTYKFIKIVSKEIKISISVKFRGLTIDNNLKSDVHINGISKVARTKIKSLSRIRNHQGFINAFHFITV